MTVNEIANWVENAVSDMAFDQVRMWEETGWDDTEGKLLVKAKADGCYDVAGWYADYLYDDPQTLADMMGDRISDGLDWRDDDYDAQFNTKVEELRTCRSGNSWGKACDLMLHK